MLSEKKPGLKTMSSVSDDLIDFIYDRFNIKRSDKKDEAKTAENKAAEAKKAEVKKEEPKKEEPKKAAPKAEVKPEVKKAPVEKQEAKKEPAKVDRLTILAKKEHEEKKNKPLPKEAGKNQNQPQNQNRNQGQNQGQNQGNRNNNQNQNRNQGQNQGNRNNNQNQNRNQGQNQGNRNNNQGNRNNNQGYNNNNRFNNRNNNHNRNNQNNNQNNNQRPQPKAPEEPTIKSIELPESLTIGELADKIKTPVNQLIKKLFMSGKMYTVNSEISYDDAENIALEYNYIAEPEKKIDIVEEALRDVEDPDETLTTRPPVVCVMGHVDHGKTSLLDAIRKTNVTEGEAGGITQAIGASSVKVESGETITFLDTPGHEAFTAMRLRGAKSTDIAILVVAADDGVMPQTVEAINHAKAAGIEIIVAVNKIDKPNADIDKVKRELSEYGLIAEDWGGSTVFCPVSAHTGEGIDNLLDMILLTSEVLELKANKDRKARGIVIEAKLDKGRGPVATLLVQKGTLHVGDYIAIGEFNGRVRAMIDDKHRDLKAATPSMPVEIIGLSGVPYAGDTFVSTDTDKEARQISEAFITRGKENLIAETKKNVSLSDIFDQMKEGSLKEFNIIIKADVQGSVEAVKQSLLKLSNDEIIIKCIHSGVGAINESDIVLASASKALVIGFNVRPDTQAKSLADQEHVDLRLYKVIYNVIDDIESAMKGMLDPIYEEKVIGHAEVRQTYKASGVGIIAGCYVLDGSVEREAKARITRGKDLIFEGEIGSLKRFKDDAKEVKAGYECGIVFDGFSDLRESDQIEVYKMVEVPRK
ncbi:MAG: translation initiation factor IF-2 [Eubacterium sp.]|nr:translation initiation factor IF-2 [Eubacterium sp.]